MNVSGHIIENFADQTVFDLCQTAGTSETAAVRQERVAGAIACVVQGLAKESDRLLACFLRRLILRIERGDFDAQRRPLEIGSLRRAYPLAPHPERRLCIKQSVH